MGGTEETIHHGTPLPLHIVHIYEPHDPVPCRFTTPCRILKLTLNGETTLQQVLPQRKTMQCEVGNKRRPCRIVSFVSVSGNILICQSRRLSENSRLCCVTAEFLRPIPTPGSKHRAALDKQSRTLRVLELGENNVQVMISYVCLGPRVF